MARRNADDTEIEESPAVQPPIDPWAVIDRLSAALENLGLNRAAAPAEGGSADLIIKLTDALARVSEAQLQGAQIIADEAKRAHRPSNEVVHNRSVLNPRGERDYPKPVPKCVMMIPWLIDKDSVTREEVQLLNLLQPGEYILRKIDGTKVRMTCRIDYALDEVTPSRLLLNHETAFNNDHKNWMPPLPEMLRQILMQKPETRNLCLAVLTMDEEEALIAAEQLPVSK